MINNSEKLENTTPTTKERKLEVSYYNVLEFLEKENFQAIGCADALLIRMSMMRKLDCKAWEIFLDWRDTHTWGRSQSGRPYPGGG